MIELRDLTLRAGGFRLERISLRVEAGRYAVLMGRTGAGKSTLLEAICGLRSVESGEILLNGRNVTHSLPAERGVGYVPQDLALFPTYTVRGHLEFALRTRGAPASQIESAVGELTALLGLESLLSRRIKNLSGGESQRVALGRALSFRPRVLLLDEPLSALDDATRNDMHALLRSVQARTGVTTLHVTHSRDEAAILADRLFVLEAGRLSETGLDASVRETGRQSALPRGSE